MTLDTHEFIRRFLMHVLPQGFHRIRYYGLLTSPTRAKNIAHIRLARSVTHPDRRHQGCPHKGFDKRSVRRAESARASLPLLRRRHAHHRDILAGATAQAPFHPASASDQDRHLMMTISQPPPPKSRSPVWSLLAAHGPARSNAVFITQQLHRSSPTYRPADRKNAWHPTCNAIPTAQPTSLPTLAVARTPPQTPIAERAAPPNTCPFPRFRPLGVFGRRP